MSRNVLKPHMVYRISRAIDKPELQGKVVTFIGYVCRHFDIRRAKVAIVNPDGSNGDEWLVTEHYVLPL